MSPTRERTASPNPDPFLVVGVRPGVRTTLRDVSDRD
jgi:hypothetical protein